MKLSSIFVLGALACTTARAQGLYVCGDASGRIGVLFQEKGNRQGQLLVMGDGEAGRAAQLVCEGDETKFTCRGVMPEDGDVCVSLSLATDQGTLRLGGKNLPLTCGYTD